MQAVADHLLHRNVQRGGPYRQSREVDAMLGRARESVAAFVNARSPDEIAFGLNATSFIRAISLAVGQTLEPRNEVVVTELDHEANIATWIALERFGARIVWWPVRDDGRLHVVDLEPLLNRRSRIVACTVASNATGSIVDVAAVARAAHAAGAEVMLDAVHYAPHAPIDVQRFDCDYLVCSGYKVFAPHMGFIWCRRESINALPTFREHFIPDVTPDKLEAGTYAYENVAGMEAAIQYLEDLGGVGDQRLEGPAGINPSRRIDETLTRIREYEQYLSLNWLELVGSVDGVVVHGVVDPSQLSERVPTLSFTVEGLPSGSVADALAVRNIGVRSGHMYSPRVITRLGLMPHGVVRASLAHYNTREEIIRFRDALVEVIRSSR
jgi:cysteine desulfurase family protein (TIGR01976 family)